MGWFSKKQKDVPVSAKTREAIVEIEASKDARREAVIQAKEASKQLNTLLVENGFTLKIYLATGGKHKGKTK